MRSIQLDNGQTARVRISHLTVDHDGEPRRATRAKLSVGNRTFVALATCHPRDNFSRKLGRRQVANNLLRKCRENDFLGQALTYHDRAAIFQAICPEYSHSGRA